MSNRITRVSLVAEVGGFVRDVRTGKRETEGLRHEAERFSKGRYEASVKANTAPARTELSALEKRLAAFGRTSVDQRVHLDTDEARDRLRQLQTRLGEFGTRVSDVRVGVDDAEAQGKISRVEAGLLALGRRTADPDIDLEGVAAAEAELSALTGRLDRFDGHHYEANIRVDGMASMTKSASLLVDTLVMLGPAMVPIAAAAAGPVASMATGMTAAATAGGSAVLAFQGVGDALKALHEGSPEEVAKAMGSLNDAGRSFVRFLDSARPELTHLQNVARSGMFPGMEAGLRELIALGPTWERIIRNSSQALGQLSREGAEALNDPFWRRFFDFIGDEANGALVKMGRSAGNVAEGLAGMVMALDPAADDFSDGLLKMTRQFSHWGRTLDTNQSFQEFVRYVQRVSPEVWKTLATVADAMLQIAEAAAPVGEVTLPIIRGVATALGAIADSEVGPVLVGTAVGFATLNRALRTFEALKASQVVTMLRGVDAEGTKASKAMTAIGRGGLILTGVLVGVSAIEELGKALDETLPGTKELERQILALDKSAAPGLSKQFDSLGASIRRLSNPEWARGGKLTLEPLVDSLKFIGDSKDVRQAKAEIGALDTAMAGLVRSKGPLVASRQFHQLAIEQNLTGQEQRELLNRMPAFRGALKGAGTDALVAAHGVTAAERATYRLGQELQHLSRRLEGRQTLRDYRNAIRDFNTQIRKSPDNLRRGTKAWDDAEESLDGIAGSALEVANRMRGVDKVRFLQKARGDFVDAATKMLGSRKAARHLADSLGLVDQKSKIQIRLRETGMDAVTQKLRRVKERADRVPRNIDARVKGDTGDADRDLGVIAHKLGDIDHLHSKPRVDVDKRKADDAIAALFRDVRRLGSQKASAQVDLNTKGYDAADQRTHKALRDLDQTKAVPKAELDDSKARAQSKAFAGFFKSTLSGIKNEPVGINLDASAEKILKQTRNLQGAQGHAAGGRVAGSSPTPTADNILMRATAREYVVRQPSAINMDREHPGALDYINATGRLPEAHAMGGPVGAIDPRTFNRGARQATRTGGRYADAVAGRFEAALTKRANELIHSMGYGVGPTLDWARRQVGDPYTWGGMGLGGGGWDCSGFMSGITDHLLGRSPHTRLFATGSFPTSMFARGLGTFSIGSVRGSPGHMAGTLGGVNVESSGDVGVHMGPSARGATDPYFGGNIWHLKPGLIHTVGFGSGADAPAGGKLNRYERYIVDHESDGNVRANNPDSTALGIGQLLYDNRLKYAARLGLGPGTLSRGAQTSMMRMYIEDRYGSSRAAYNFHRSHGWYDNGGVARGRGVMFKNTPQPERMLSPRQTLAFERLVAVLDRRERGQHDRVGHDDPIHRQDRQQRAQEAHRADLREWRKLRESITKLTMNQGRPISRGWLSDVLERLPKTAEQLRREFIRTRDALRGFHTHAERARRSLERIHESDRYQDRAQEARRARRRLEAARSGEAIGGDVHETRQHARQALRQARRSPVGRDALADYRKASQALEKERDLDQVKAAQKRARWRKQEARERLTNERAPIIQARNALEKANKQVEDADNKHQRRRARQARQEARADLRQARQQPDSARKKQAREEVDRANRRMKTLREERSEIEKLTKQRDHAGRQSGAVRELVHSRKRLENLREERKERAKLRREARRTGNADILEREDKAQERLNKRIKAEKQARTEAKKAAEAYRAAQEAAVQRARAVTTAGMGLGGIEAASFKTSGGILSSLRRGVQTVRSWGQLTRQLVGAGLRGPILAEYIDAGPSEEAVRTGRSLLAGGQIGEINRLQDQLRAESVRAGAYAASGSVTSRMASRNVPVVDATGTPRAATPAVAAASTVNTVTHVTNRAVNVDIRALDISQVSGEIRRQVQHVVRTELMAGEV